MKKRKLLRLPGFDYTSDGYYFITIVIKDRATILSEIVNGNVILSAYGKIAEKEWLRTSEIRPNVRLHSYIIMPDHIHAILELRHHTGADCNPPLHNPPLHNPLLLDASEPKHLGSIIRGFKIAVIKQLKNNFPDDTWLLEREYKIWQRSYHDRIIRNEQEYFAISNYILTNPERWK